MIRSIAALGLIVALAAPAGAHTDPAATSFTWQALPCAVACSYWVDNGFTPCEVPFPPGSWDDHLTVGAPAPPQGKIVVLQATLDATIDYDLFFCANNDARTELPCCGGILGDPCSGPASNLVPIGCHEDGATPVVSGQQVILRAYNWSDVSHADGAYWFTIV